MRIRVLKTALRYAFLAVISLALLTGRGVVNRTHIEELAGSRLYSLTQWEVENFPDKWLYRVRLLLPGSSLDEQAKVDLVLEYSRLSERERELEGAILKAWALSPTGEDGQLHALEAELARVQDARVGMRNRVEEIMEGLIDSIVFQEGLSLGGPISALGVHFPPVDIRIDHSPPVMVTSPRDRIEMIGGVLLRPDTTVEEMAAIEELITEEKDLSVLVQGTGGVATFPAVISPDFSLRGTLITAAHEWMHHYLFFHPLGRTYGKNPQMTSLNETVANIFGGEVGELAYKRFKVEQEAPTAPQQAQGQAAAAEEFDFRTEMRTTRFRAEELLAEGSIEEAEQYMEDRRLFLADHGHYIRKLNQAYFAFHGNYADSPASISPIHQQLRTLRDDSSSLGDFVRRVASVSSYEEFLELLEDVDAGQWPTIRHSRFARV